MPVVGLNVLGVLSLAVDTAMCGRLPEADRALAALGFAGQIIFLLLVVMMGLTVGSVALVARAHGARHHGRADHILAQSVQLTFLVSILVSAVGLASADSLLHLLGATRATRALSLQYLRPLLGLTVFYYLNVLYAGILRGVGNTVLPFLVALAYNTLNVVLNYGLIFGHLGMPALGVAGAAWGTVASQAFGALLTTFLLARETVPGVRLRVRLAPVDHELARQLFRIGFPAALDMVILNVAFFTVVGMLGRVSEAAVAAHGVGLRIQSLAFVPGLGVAQATGAMVGQALGAGRPEEARAVTRAAMVLACAIMSVLGAGMVLGASWIIEVAFHVVPSTELGSYALTWMRLLGLSMPIVGLHIALVGMLRGAGATNTSLAINALGTLAFQVPLSYLLGFTAGLGPFGIWFAMTPCAFAVRLLLGVAAYREGSWAKPGLATA